MELEFVALFKMMNKEENNKQWASSVAVCSSRTQLPLFSLISHQVLLKINQHHREQYFGLTIGVVLWRINDESHSGQQYNEV